MQPTAVALSLALVLALLATPHPSHGQQPGKVYRIGWLGTAFFGTGAPTPTDTNRRGCPKQGNRLWNAFVEGLREHGYVPDQNLVLECRWTGGRDERAPALAAELVNLKPDLIVALSTNTFAAKQATRAIPIVMVAISDPVGRGLVPSLAHPGGNVTGPSYHAGVEIVGKYLELLKEVVPTASRVARLWYRTDVPSPDYRGAVEAAAQALQVTLQRYDVRAPEELEGAFAAMTKARAEALLVLPHAFWLVYSQRIVTLAAKNRLPGMYTYREHVEAGGLMSYENDRAAIFRRVGFYVDKILHGTKPGDLPVEQPNKYELVINLKTAKALGLTIPQSLLMRADEVIQ